MTIPAVDRVAGPFAGDGVTTTYPFTFKVFDQDDISVVRADANGVETTLVRGGGYTVSLNGDQDVNPGGTVTLTAPLPTNYRLAIQGGVPYDQPMSLPDGGMFNPHVIEEAFDRLAIQIQQNKSVLERTARVQVTSTASVEALSDAIVDLVGLGPELTAVAGVANYLPTVAGISGDIAAVGLIAGDVTTVAGIASDVTTVAGNTININKVAAIDTSVSTVAASDADVTTVAGIASDVTAVTGNTTNINKVAAIDTAVTAVAAIDANVTTVAGIASDVTAVTGNTININKVAAIDTAVTAVAAIDTDVTTVAGIASDVTTVVGNATNVNKVAAIDTAVTAVAAIDTDVTTVSGMGAAITTVNANATNINKVAAIDTAVTAVAAIDTNVATVAGISGDVTTVAGIKADIQAVPAQVQLAEDWAIKLGGTVDGVEFSAKYWAQQASAAGQLSDANPKAPGTASPGTGTKSSREDHVHPLPPVATTSVTGLMPSTDKAKVDNLGTVYTKNVPASGDAAAGEVVLGSDTRLSDARAPTSHNHDAAQITSGTLGVALIPNLDAAKITSGTLGVARIPNLDAAKITTGSLPLTRGGTGGTSAATARSNLGLGSAATASVTTSSKDTTAGRLLKVGDFGLGAMVALGTSNLNTVTDPGEYVQASAGYATTGRNYPTGAGFGFLSVYGSELGSGKVGTLQQYVAADTGDTYIRGTRDGSSWGSWLMRPTSANVKRIAVVSSMPGSPDANTLYLVE